MIWPVPRAPDGRAPNVSSPFGMRDARFHYGVDIMWPRHKRGEAQLPEFSPRHYMANHTPALAIADGIVINADNAGNPHRVRIDHGHGLLSQYIHLFDVKVRRGQHVHAGQPIGIIGYNPNGYRLNHLHFELIHNEVKVDPAPILAHATVVAAPTHEWLKALGIALPLLAVAAGFVLHRRSQLGTARMDSWIDRQKDNARVRRWIQRNPPPAHWRGSAMEYAFTEMPFAPY